MKCVPLGMVLGILSLAWCLPSENSTSRSPQEMKETIKTVTNQLIETNSPIPDVLDVRTPPKIKQQQKQKLANENSVIGVAIPVDEDSIEMEETTKKLHFYKIERPTTNSGLSTWILLSGQTASTTKSPPKKPSIKPIVENDIEKNKTTIEKPNRIIKPIFKKRVTTLKPTTENVTKKSTSTPTTQKPKNTTTTKLTKIKASLLNNAVNKKNNTNSTTNIKKTTTPSTSTVKPTTTTVETPSNSTTNSTILPMEAKEGETDLSTKTNKKKKNKRKNNKNRRRKPSNETSLKIPEDKPIGTQLYNYLSREIMPTVGVGLAGLMVAAGLASYFLYPFGIARRTYEIDRKDKEGTYYYNDEFSGGIPEEEAIGKVIAGMPENSLQSNNFKTPTSRNTYPTNVRYRQVDRRSQNGMVQGSVESVQLTPKDMEQNFNSRYPSDNQRFVVGNVPKDAIEEVTPASVPEHGPRSLNKQFVVGNIPKEAFDTIRETKSSNRRKRDVPDDFENDIMSDQSTTTTEKVTTTVESKKTTTPRPNIDNKVSIFDLLKELLHLKVRLGLELVQNVTRAFSTYVSNVQSRLNEHYHLNNTSDNF